MAECNLTETTLVAGPKGSGTITLKYLLLTDSVLTNPLDALAVARTLGAPAYGAQYTDTFWFAQNFRVTRNEKNRQYWFIEADFSLPPDGEDEDQVTETNPLDRPPVYDVQYIEQEYVIKEARNIDEFGSVFIRAPGTLGPIVNAAYRRPDEPIVDTERNAIVVIERNYSNLGEVMALNETYQRTCNSDSVIVGGQSIHPRRLKYLVTRSLGKQVENGVTFYPGVTEIELKRTTDLYLDNVGYEAWDDDEADYVRAKDAAGEFVADPVNLDLEGKLSDSLTTIGYRHLTEVAYADFFA